MVRPALLALGLCLGLAASASAQLGTSGTSPAQSASGAVSGASPDTRPATTTFLGDTGLWFVPTAEVLAHGKWSASGYRRGTNYIQGFSNVGDFAGTFAYGIKDRAEVFGSFIVDTRVDRDLRPLFVSDAKVGGIIDRYPRMSDTWSGDNVGDFYVGAKVNLWSEATPKKAALAVRGTIKLPTGDDAAGVSTGQTDFALDFIASKELRRMIELSGYGGYEWRGSPDDVEIPGGAFRWGAGAGYPSRGALRGTFELNGVIPSDDVATITGAPFVATDGSIAPLVSSTENITRATIGATWQKPNGFFVGGGVSWNLPMKSRDDFRADSDPFGDYLDWQIRIGFHPGVRTYVPPPPPVTAAPPPPPVVPQNRPPTVTAQCDPCSVQVGQTSNLTANGQDPDGDQLTYRWTVPQGTLATPGNRVTVWTAPNQECTVPATVTVSDGKGGTATANVNLTCTRPPVRNCTFEDVHFDFDRYSLRPEATRVLDEAVNALGQDTNLRIEIEGHTCNIGTAEYNLALGDRRANAVRDYLTSRGVGADRLRTISYGEERPKYENAREETRRLNRRAALTVNLRQ
jgi:outer membrane protein OmpA-like peptidoglycan-associated protein